MVPFHPVACFQSAAMDKEQLIHEVDMKNYLYDASLFHYKTYVRCQLAGGRSPGNQNFLVSSMNGANNKLLDILYGFPSKNYNINMSPVLKSHVTNVGRRHVSYLFISGG